MKRREFLGYSALGALLLSTAGTMGYALARQHSHGAPPVSLAVLPPGGQPLQPLPRIVNLSDAAGRFRSALTPGSHRVPLSEELEARLWLYNGKVAPLIEVREGDELDITLINELEQDTTLHWHGVPVPHAHDGAPWDAVAPGESRRYRYAFPRGVRACTGSTPTRTRARPGRSPTASRGRCWFVPPLMSCLTRSRSTCWWSAICACGPTARWRRTPPRTG